MILVSPMLSAVFGKKAIAVVGFGLTTIVSALFYFVAPEQIGWMVALTIAAAIMYGPTIPLLWAMFADVADYGEWSTGRRTTGIIFATIGFALKAGLSLGAFVLLFLLARYGYRPNESQSPEALSGIRLCASIYPTILFAICTVLLLAYSINKRLTLQIADELAMRRESTMSGT
jgi:Na+/melibiose symporter-like transporter